MSAFLAATPLAVILIGMGVLRRSAIVAGGAGLAIALLLSFTVYRPADGELAPLMRGVAAEASHTTLTILWIILPALAIFEFKNKRGPSPISGMRLRR